MRARPPRAPASTCGWLANATALAPPRWSWPPARSLPPAQAFPPVTGRAEMSLVLDRRLSQVKAYLRDRRLRLSSPTSNSPSGPQMLLRRLWRVRPSARPPGFSRRVLSWQEVAIGDSALPALLAGRTARSQLEQTGRPFAALPRSSGIPSEAGRWRGRAALDYAKAEFRPLPPRLRPGTYRLVQALRGGGPPGTRAWRPSDLSATSESLAATSYSRWSRVSPTNPLGAHGAASWGFEV